MAALSEYSVGRKGRKDTIVNGELVEEGPGEGDVVGVRAEDDELLLGKDIHL